ARRGANKRSDQKCPEYEQPEKSLYEEGRIIFHRNTAHHILLNDTSQHCVAHSGYRNFPFSRANSRKTGWSQGVDATLACSLSAGVRNPKVCRGRVLSRRAISSSSDCENLDRSAFFGRYCRSRPFVFSFEPRCQGLCGSQK